MHPFANKFPQRLGDGFYEQRLVREQIASLTGRRFLDSYANDEAQYRVTVSKNGIVAPRKIETQL